MLKHIVLFKLKGNNDFLKNELVDGLISLKKNIKHLNHFKIYKSALNHRPVHYDIMLEIIFLTKEELNSYTTHNLHQNLLNFIVGNFDMAVFDTEIK